MKAIPTTYASTRFRSRNEARWAAFFDGIEWKWEYEIVEGFAYIPDFVILGSDPVIVEIKPDVEWETLAQYVPKIERGLKGKWDHDILIVGSHPFHDDFYNGDTIGYLGEYYPDVQYVEYCESEGIEYNPEPGWEWDAGIWNWCGCCGMATFFHAKQSFRCRICGHGDGDAYIRPIDDIKESLQGIWRAAGTLTRWNP